ncbi:hypothetical protein T08_13452 [Trichinella sp. T8]|nr:hypothetical protein T08_13452 [Trichinella sp. T8]
MWYSQRLPSGLTVFPSQILAALRYFQKSCSVLLMQRTLHIPWLFSARAASAILSGEFGNQVACRRCTLCVVYLAFCDGLGLYSSSILYSRRSDADECSRTPPVFLWMPSPQSVLLEFFDIYHNVTSLYIIHSAINQYAYLQSANIERNMPGSG